MKNNKGFAEIGIILSIIVVLIVGAGAYYFGTKNNSTPKSTALNNNKLVPAEKLDQNSTDKNSVTQTTTIQPNLDQTPKVSSGSEDTTCYQNPKYFVIAQQDTLSAGDNILIKYKTNADQNISCEYSVDKTDYELKNTCSYGPVCYLAQYVSNIEGNLLIVDEGTGPDNRNIIIYDLTKRAKVFSDTYSTGDLSYLQNNTIIYWVNTNEIANKQNCPEIDEYQKMGGKAVLESKISLNLSSLTKNGLGEYRCSYAE